MKEVKGDTIFTCKKCNIEQNYRRWQKASEQTGENFPVLTGRMMKNLKKQIILLQL